MKPFVLDSSAVLRFSDNEAGADRVREIVMLARQGKVEIYMSPVNWGEVAYAFIHANKSRATLAALKKTLPVVFPDLTDKDAEQAGYLKEAWKLHYADAFAAALTDHLSGVLVTSDFEFKAVTGQINIEFLPKKP